ncbi:hypothetical protein H8959_005956 [Pygathrix nigripes]
MNCIAAGFGMRGTPLLANASTCAVPARAAHVPEGNVCVSAGMTRKTLARLQSFLGNLAGSGSTAPGGLASYEALTCLPAAHKVRAAAQTLGKCGLPVPAVRGTGTCVPHAEDSGKCGSAVGARGQSRDNLRAGGRFQARERFGAVSFPEVGGRYLLTSYAARQVHGEASSGRLRGR